MKYKDKIEKLRAAVNKEQLKDKAATMWEATLPALLESVSESDMKLMTSILQSQWDNIQHCKYNMSDGVAAAYESDGDISRIIVPAVRRIFDDFPIRKLVGVQPITELVDNVYTLEYKYVDVKPVEGMLGAAGKKMELNVIQHEVEARARKLQAAWTPAKKEDLVHCRGLDIECEKIQALSQEVRLDITTEVIFDLKRIAGEPELVVYKGDTQVDRDESLKALCCRIRSNCTSIAMSTRRGHGNWIVVSEAMAKALSSETYAGFKPNEKYKSKSSEILEFGTMNDTIRIFVADVPDDEILIGYKGTNGDVDTGYIYCPHTPMMTGGMCVHPTTFEPILPFMTRYSKFAGDKASAYYRNIKVESDLIKKK